MIRPLSPSDRDWILALNAANVEMLSPLDAERLTALAARAFLAVVAEPEAGFLLAFDERADYDSPNFLWFRERYDRFVYVDRIVVAPEARRTGAARRLYAELFAGAAATGRARVACEVNSHPPNPASDAFHGALGFAPVGEARLGGEKRVRYLVREAAASEAAA